MSKKTISLWFLLTTILLVISVNRVFAIEYGGIGGRPAFPRPDSPRSESIFVHEISPKEVINEGIKVINNTQETKTLLIYATDDTPSTDGGFACKQFSEPKTGVGNWIKLEKDEVTLGSMTSEVVPFTIIAPEDADVGEHDGCIIVQEKKEKSETAGLNLSFRTGISVSLTIPGEIIRLLEMVGFKVVDKDENTYVLTPTIKNLGNTSVNANIKVAVTNVLTKKVREFGGEYSVLKNNPLSLNYEFKKPFWGGIFKAKTIVTYKDGKNVKTLESQEISFISYPQKQALIYIGLVLLVLITTTILFITKRRRRAQITRGWVNYTVASGDSLNGLASKRRISWKEIVSINKLKPPYDLKSGQKIKLPPVEKFVTRVF